MIETRKESKNRNSRCCLMVLAVLMAVVLAGCSCGVRNDDMNTTDDKESNSTAGTDPVESSSGTANEDASMDQEAEESTGGDYIFGGDAELRFRAGTYEGEGTGYAGPVSVTVTVTEDKIVSIDAVYESESENVGQVAIPKLIDQIIESNGSKIDVISGATYSSKGLLDAVNEALRQAAEDQQAQ